MPNGWEEIRRQYLDLYPDDLFWGWLKAGMPEGPPKAQRGRAGISGAVDIDASLKTWWDFYGKNKAEIEKALRPPTTPETEEAEVPEVELPGRVTLPSGQTVDVDWAYYSEYTSPLGFKQDIYVPVLPLSLTKADNIGHILKQVYGEETLAEITGAGITLGDLELGSQYIAVSRQVMPLFNVGTEEALQAILDTYPALSDYIIDWAKGRITGKYLEQGGDEAFLKAIQDRITKGTLLPTELEGISPYRVKGEKIPWGREMSYAEYSRRLEAVKSEVPKIIADYRASKGKRELPLMAIPGSWVFTSGALSPQAITIPGSPIAFEPMTYPGLIPESAIKPAVEAMGGYPQAAKYKAQRIEPATGHRLEPIDVSQTSFSPYYSQVYPGRQLYRDVTTGAVIQVLKEKTVKAAYEGQEHEPAESPKPKTAAEIAEEQRKKAEWERLLELSRRPQEKLFL